MKISRLNMILLSLATLVGFGVMGIASIYFIQDVSLSQLLHNGKPISDQLLRGGSFGLAAFLLAFVLIKSSFLRGSGDMLTRMIKAMNPTLIEVAFYSFCAGVGEELLFRGGIQPLFSDIHTGVWITSVIFIVLHGYLNPLDIQMTIYGILMVFISAGIGYLFIMSGLYASMTSHFVFDLLMFMYLKYGPEEEEEEEPVIPE